VVRLETADASYSSRKAEGSLFKSTHTMTNDVGAIARAREDAANGASHYIGSKTRLDSNAKHIVSQALRRSIADAYAAYTGQVDGVPADTYGA